MIRRLREDQERGEQRAAKAKRMQERRAAAERGKAVMADESATVERDKAGGSSTAAAVPVEEC